MDQIHVALNQFSESWFRAAADVLFQEFSAVCHLLFISKDPLNAEIRQKSLQGAKILAELSGLTAKAGKREAIKGNAETLTR